MIKRGALAALVIGVAAILLSRRTSNAPPQADAPSFRRGKNNTILFLTNSESGLANVLLATAQAIVTDHPDVDVHLASFQAIEKKFTKVAEFTSKHHPSAKQVHLHPLPGTSLGAKAVEKANGLEGIIHPPGFKGAYQYFQRIGVFFTPWSGPEYLAIYNEMIRIFDEVDPSIVVIEGTVEPGFDAIKDQNRNYVVLSPNTLKENAGPHQGASMLWKYPIIGSGFPYPLPWNLIPQNIYLNLYLVYQLSTLSHVTETREYLKSKGLNVTRSILLPPGADAPLCIDQTAPEVDFPMVIPENFRVNGPIILSFGAIEEQDPEMAQWLKRAPTVLISLGSVFTYDEKSATEMAKAIKFVLSQTKVQVLWKLSQRQPLSEDVLKDLSKEIEDKRLRIEGWINADLSALLGSGDVILSVNHGGASCFAEAVFNGVPQLILPVWADLYDYATRVEYAGIGYWANKKTAPEFNAEELGTTLVKALGDSPEATSMRDKAKKVGQKYQANPGSKQAAKNIVERARNSN